MHLRWSDWLERYDEAHAQLEALEEEGETFTNWRRHDEIRMDVKEDLAALADLAADILRS